MPRKFLEIDTFKKEDTNALFEALCVQACDIPIVKGKMLVRPKLTKEDAKTHIADLDDLLVLVKVYDIPFSFKVSFLERMKGEMVKQPDVVPEFDDNLKVCEVYKTMEKQNAEIKNQDLIDLVQKKNKEVPIEDKGNNESLNINLGDIPDF